MVGIWEAQPEEPRLVIRPTCDHVYGTIRHPIGMIEFSRDRVYCDFRGERVASKGPGWMVLSIRHIHESPSKLRIILIDRLAIVLTKWAMAAKDGTVESK